MAHLDVADPNGGAREFGGKGIDLNTTDDLWTDRRHARWEP
jgi:hypothetical protein